MGVYKDLICLFYDYVPTTKAEKSGFESGKGQEVFLFARAIRPGSGAHSPSYPMGTGVCFPGNKEAEERS
jgi:hypothetical protein